jgi:NAD(P)-dependent dehydrogenase (short-subunit alcohol dehydrogenase family)
MGDTVHAAGAAIVTGAGGGIGAACAHLLASDGWGQLILTDRDAAPVNALVAELRAKGVAAEALIGDIADPAFPELLGQKLGGRAIAAFIHAAGVSSKSAEPRRILEINLDASLRLVEFTRPRMANGGAMVLVASIMGHCPVSLEADATFEQPMPAEGSTSLMHLLRNDNDAYCLAKRAVIALARREAMAFGKRNARIVSISPGFIDTQMVRDISPDADAVVAGIIANGAIPRKGRPEEVAATAVFLCSPDAGFITGCDIRVDGGELIGMGL